MNNIIKPIMVAGALAAATATHAMSMAVGAVEVPFDRIEDPSIKPILVEYMGFLNSDNACPEASSKWHARCKDLEQSLVEVLNSTDTQVAAKD